MRQQDYFSNDAGLIEAIRAGDQEAFRFLVEKYQHKVIRTVMGFVHSIADAEDIAQEVFIEIYQSVNRFRGESDLSTWIYRITVNKSLNFLKSSFRRKIISVFDFTEDGNIGKRSDPEASREYYADNDISRSEQGNAVKKAVDSLPSKQRTAFILSKYEDLSYKEIAVIMNTSVPSVESLIFRGRKSLQKKLLNFYKKNMV